MRYALFAGVSYYARGGWNDMIETSDDLDKLRPQILPTPYGSYAFTRSNGKTIEPTWWQIVDLQEGMVVESFGEAYKESDYDSEEWQ